MPNQAPSQTERPGALTGLRVLDLSGDLGNYCGKLFADMGADVILIEPPSGSELRFEPPFIGNMPALENSLSFAYHNTSKRGVTLDLDTATGQAMFKELAARAEVIIETSKPGTMARRGLCAESIHHLYPQIVYTSITPFGSTGPYAHYEADDITALAMGGLLYLGGYADTAPIRVYGKQAILCANMFASVATMLAVLEAEAGGLGQHVDVSMQEAVSMALETSVQYLDLEGLVRKRHAGEQRFAGTGVYPCLDGQIYLMAGGVGANKFWERTVQWFNDEKMPGTEAFQGDSWKHIEYLRSDEAKAIFEKVFVPWSRTKTKGYLYHEGQRRKIPIAPISETSDLLSSRQLAFRRYFVEVLRNGHSLLMPGAPYKLDRTPWRIQRPAPLLGQHNTEVYGEIGISPDELTRLFSRRII